MTPRGNVSTTYRVGVDTGGTFTDLVLTDPAGLIVTTHKRLSTPSDPSQAVLEGIDALLAQHGQGLTRRDIEVTHGSTVATNALLESQHANTAFVTTAGFEDTLHLARQNRPELYALSPHRPTPPVQRERCIGIEERTGHDGRIIEPLNKATLKNAIKQIIEWGVDSVAISLLHSYANPTHEKQVLVALQDALGNQAHITASHELLPVFREYERAAVCVINAAVAPRMTRYLRRLEAGLAGPPLYIMGSHGGTISVDSVCREPVRTILSGPAGGVLGAAALGDKLITLDMGGTSTDVALIEKEPTLSTEHQAAGLPVRLPMVDIHTVGAGGGSIAWVDAGGALRVGPRSAGASPGPACYGKQRELIQQGDQKNWLPTVTDAHVALGHFAPDIPLGSGLQLDADAAQKAIAQLAETTSLTVEEAAQGVLRVVEVNMARAVHRISLQRGRDPRDYALVPFGGAGGLHACPLAEQLGMSRVLVPGNPGLLSAVGMLTAPPRTMATRSMLKVLDVAKDTTTLRIALEEMEAGVANGTNTTSPEGTSTRFSFDLRYSGQSHEINVELSADSTAMLDVSAFIERFTQQHEHLNGYRLDDQPIELVAIHMIRDGTRKPVRHETGSGQADTVKPNQHIPRGSLSIGTPYPGPFIITETSATTVIPIGWNVTVQTDGVLDLQRNATHDA